MPVQTLPPKPAGSTAPGPRPLLALRQNLPDNNAGPVRFRGFQPGTILGRFQLFALIIAILATLALGLCFWSLTTTSGNFRELVTRLTPALEAAQSLGQAIEEMDARAADYQLTYRIDVSSPDFIPAVYGADGLRSTLWNEMEERRLQVDNALGQLRTKARSSTELDAINRLNNRFYDYYAQLRLMRYELDLGHKEAALANYKGAEDILVGNLGNPARDAQGNSKEQALQNNNWAEGTFTCATNCPSGAAGKPAALKFDTSATYEGIAANIQKLIAINRQKLGELGTPSGINNILVIISAVLVTLFVLVLSVYYALLTHRVINPGFFLAFVVGIAVAVLLITTLESADRDYRLLSTRYVKGIIDTSAVQQLSADAGADVSRLLLSPSSPGLDSTNLALTPEVKQAFARDNLLAAYATRRTQIDQNLAGLWSLVNTPTEKNELCKVTDSPEKICGNNNGSGWQKFQQEITQTVDRFDRKLLADAIQININPKTVAGSDLGSAREQYNRIVTSLEAIGNQNKLSFDRRSCAVIGQSQFGNSCGDQSGYLNQLQVIIWVAFPLLSLLVSAGVWLASRLF